MIDFLLAWVFLGFFAGVIVYLYAKSTKVYESQDKETARWLVKLNDNLTKRCQPCPRCHRIGWLAIVTHQPTGRKREMVLCDWCGGVLVERREAKN